MKITKNTVVLLSYELSFPDENGNPELAEIVNAEEPMGFIQGMSGLPESFENNLEGLAVGDTFDFSIEPEDAYGKIDPNAIVDLPKNLFQIDGKDNEELLKIGNFIPMTDDQGNRMQGMIIQIKPETVTMDFNHPLAEKTLMFKGQVLEVRAATAEEIAHGHVHGAGGVHHH
jgi:FKBP-type peptidyl-prolyl cis-trans isomerase SlyD